MQSGAFLHIGIEHFSDVYEVSRAPPCADAEQQVFGVG